MCQLTDGQFDAKEDGDICVQDNRDNHLPCHRVTAVKKLSVDVRGKQRVISSLGYTLYTHIHGFHGKEMYFELNCCSLVRFT